MDRLEPEIATYERLRDSLEAEHRGKWAIVHGETHVGTYATFEEAAQEAVRRFGRGPYLIREIGAPPICLPSPLRYEPLRVAKPTEHLGREIATYERLRDSLEAEHRGKWAVVHGETYVGAYATFEEAVQEAFRRFGRGPYLIREIGAPPIRIPGTVLEQRVHFHN